MNLLPFDLSVSRYVQTFHHPIFIWFMEQLSWWGEPEHFIFILAITCAFLIFTNLYRQFLLLFISTVSAGLIGYALKYLIARPRPPLYLVRVSTYTTEASFPSNHVLVFTVFFGLLIYFTFRSSLKDWLKIILVTIFGLFVFFISVSRIYLGAHWFTDCLAGYLIGASILYIVNKLYKNQ